MRQAALARDKRSGQPRHPRLALTATPTGPRHLIPVGPVLQTIAEIARMGEDRNRLTPGDPVATAIANAVLMLEESIGKATNLGTVVDVNTAADILSLSPSMVRILCARGPDNGGLDAQKLGGEWRITHASVEARLGKGR